MFDPEESGPAEIPDYDHIEDEAFPPLPPPHSPGQGGGEEADPFGNGEEDGEVSRLEEVPAAKRKGIRRPQPKLDTHRLISERGLPALRTLFDNVRFKGKGHEAEDLQLLMHKMENWAHRLYPKLQFSDFIDKVEKLGSKKDVQTCLKRIRLDMPLTHDDFISKDDEEEAPGPNVFGDPDPFGGGNFHDDPLGPVHSTPAPAAPAPATPAPTTPSLTEEQRKRMELNRRLALERRMARKQPQQTDPSDSQPADVPSASSSSTLPRQSKDQAEEAKDSDPDRDGAELVEQVPPEDPGRSPDSPQGGQREPGFSSVPQLGTGGEDSD